MEQSRRVAAKAAGLLHLYWEGERAADRALSESESAAFRDALGGEGGLVVMRRMCHQSRCQ